MRWALLLFCLALRAAPVAEFTGAAAFTVVSGRGEVATVGEALRLTVAERLLQAASPPFAVTPWRLLRLHLDADLDRGVWLAPQLQFRRADAWQLARPTDADGAWLVGVPPGVTEARLVLEARVPEHTVGRTATIRRATVEDVAPLVHEATGNLYWNGSFEIPTPGDVPANWHKWNDAEEWECRADGGADGDRYLRVTVKRTYFFLPQVPVLPRRVYRFSVALRGEGHCWFGTHKLAPQDPAGNYTITQRIGWSGPPGDGIQLEADRWQTVSWDIVVEDRAILWGEPYIVFGGGTIDIDAVDIRALAE